ncbi:aspartate kinase [Winogradskyella sp. 3972H.M.0a.05]|uniref:aspartate kinase n=1 Tax=Winogradskyella sp. 3972H.M.0a.05 TaxID=2950277 RepID=UPI003399CE9A
MSSHKNINIVVFGIGNVGSTFVQQIIAAKKDLQQQQQLQVNLVAITNSQYAFFNEDGVSDAWEANFKTASFPYQVSDIIKYVNAQRYENLIAIDATASEDLVRYYIPLIQNGFHIVSANKIANTLHYEFYKELRQALKKYNKEFLYETNVGAGLPIIDTIKNLYLSGDKIQKIRGVFSGSLSYIFNAFSSEDLPFSKVLNNASKIGLTEPDAREDLSGKDVARKLLILARELNIESEFNDVEVQSLVPKKLNGKTTLHQFNTRKRELDEPFLLLKKSIKNNRVLRYVAELDTQTKKMEVKLTTVDKFSALGQLKDADSIFEVYTESYGNTPLIIQGAGAGKSVTARGLFADVLKVSHSLN